MSRRRTSSAFTLLETLIVLAIVGLLVALLAPNLARVRDAGREIRSLANLRSITTAFAAYHNDFDEMFPYITDPRASYSVVRCASSGHAVSLRYFAGAYYYHLPMSDAYFGGVCRDGPFRSPWQSIRGSHVSDYTLPCVFLADPTFWRSETRRVPPDQLRPTRLHEVLHPAAKSLLLEDMAEADLPPDNFTQPDPVYRLAAVDGHARRWRFSQIETGMWTCDGAWEGPYSLHFPGEWLSRPGLHTLDGIRGRDFLP